MEPPDYGDVDRMEGSGDLSENVEGRTLTDLVANLIGGGLAMGTAVFQGSDPSTVALRNGAYTGAANDSAMEASSGPGYDQSSSSLATEAASTSRGAGHESDGSIQTPCRHGKACSHQSASHRARFSHPDDDLAARISNSNSKTEKPDNSSAVFANGEATDSADSSGTDGMPGETGCFVCNECGLGFASVRELRLHMVRKTAWSNQGLIGCRVSCLVDNREWHEGLVTQYHKSGKHCVEYRRSGDKRWVNMQKSAFYIVERAQPSGGEVKEMESDPTEGLAPIEKWHYQEDISSEFCVALSLLHRSYGSRIQETGHKTVGHTCVTDRDKVAARQVKGSLLYGELLPRGVNKAMGPTHLDAAKARTVFDLGMGTGKVAMQVFLQFPNLTRVYGIELSQARFTLGEAALFKLMELQPGGYRIKRHVPGKCMSIETLPSRDSSPVASVEEEKGDGAGGSVRAEGGMAWAYPPGAPGRILEFVCGNLFDVPDISTADLVLLETDVSSDVHPQLSTFMSRMRKGSQALTYLDLRKMWSSCPFPFRQVEVNQPLSDRFPTSWSVHRGHHFFLWSKSLPSLQPPRDQSFEKAAQDRRRDRHSSRKGNSLVGAACEGGNGVDEDGPDSARSSRGNAQTGGSEVVPSKGRRGPPKFPRFSFLSCLGLGKKKKPPPREAYGRKELEVHAVAAETAPRSGTANSENRSRPQLRDMFLPENGLGDGDSVEASPPVLPRRLASGSLGAWEPQSRRVTHPRCPDEDVAQQGSSRGQELTEAAELGAMRSPAAGYVGSEPGGCTSM